MTTNIIPTSERLAQALEAENTPLLAGMIIKARQGYYDDYKSPLAFPITQLIDDLRGWGFTSLVCRAVAGEFDSTKEEAEAWANSPEGVASFRSLFGKGE